VAGTAIATVAAGGLGVGTYEIIVFLFFGTAGTANNVQLQHGVTPVNGALMMPAVGNVIIGPFKFSRVTVAAGETISINTIATDAIGAYSAEIIATRVS
jgi:hypothetical protein